ncbi:MAG: helix-turn-helix transcriptional regulator [Crocinitomicaceae bacterium]|nr:helix-turn-helix transcriptional regulator [Crocinitomicaceae bacterium]
MQEPEQVVCNMDMFDEDSRHFWTDNLNGVLEKFPSLEFPHKQSFYILVFVETAEGVITIDNQKIRIDEAKVIIIPPGCINSIDINRQARGKIICFSENFFSLRYNNNTLYQFTFLQRGAKPFIRLNSEQLNKWKVLLEMLIDEFRQKRKESQKALRSYLNIILVELERLYKPTGFVKRKNIRYDKVQQFEDLIDKHYTTKKLPSAYADLLHVSPNYLNKICKEEKGQTAGDLIRKRIIIEAQRLLHYTYDTVSEIADQLGFVSVSYFVTFFKKNTGISPESFRKSED